MLLSKCTPKVSYSGAGLEVGESLLDFSTALVALTNLTRVLQKGTTISDAFGAEPVDPGDVLIGDREPPAL